MTKRLRNAVMLYATIVAATAIPSGPAAAQDGAPPPPWTVIEGACSDWKGTWAMQHVGPGHWIGTQVLKVVTKGCDGHPLGYQNVANIDFVTHHDRSFKATATNPKDGSVCRISGTVTSPNGASGSYVCDGPDSKPRNILINAPKPFFNMGE